MPVSPYSLLRTLVISVVCILGCGLPALSSVVYSYTGPDYVPEMCSGTYVANCSSLHLTGSFSVTVSLNQLENVTEYSIPLSDVGYFFFQDGNGVTLSQSNATVSTLEITTDGSGNIDFWDISFAGKNGSSFIQTYFCPDFKCSGVTVGGGDSSGTSPTNAGGTEFEPIYGNVWTAPLVTPAPEGSGGLFALTGLIILVGFRIVRHRGRPTFFRG